MRRLPLPLSLPLPRLHLSDCDSVSDSVSSAVAVADSVLGFLCLLFICFVYRAGRVASAFECSLFYSYFKYALTSESSIDSNSNRIGSERAASSTLACCGCFNYNLSACCQPGQRQRQQRQQQRRRRRRQRWQAYLKLLTFICC